VAAVADAPAIGSPAALPAIEGPRPAGPGAWRLAGINAFWFGGQGMWNAVYLLLAASATLAAPGRGELVVGLATAAGGLFAVLVPLLAGPLSDRTRSRFGRRTPWIVAGTALNLAGLALLAWAPSVPVITSAYLVLQLGNNAAGAAFAAIIPDLVPEGRRGLASSFLNVAALLGTIACLGLTTVLLGVSQESRAGVAASYGAIGAIIVGGLALGVVLLRERSSVGVPVPPALRLSRSSLAAALAPLRQGDFFWVIATRMFQTLGIWTILPFVPFYFADVVRAPNSGRAAGLWLLAVIGAAVLPALACGHLSDRTGRRKPFVYASSGLQAAVSAVLLVALVSDLVPIYLLGVAFGVGYGAFSAVDWALATDVLPDRERAAAKDMAVFHVAYTLPQVLAPGLLAPVLFLLNQPGHAVAGLATGGHLGYRVVFASAALWFALATVMVRRIKGVR
jgi:MFS family permease